jgi:hypothetical protein
VEQLAPAQLGEPDILYDLAYDEKGTDLPGTKDTIISGYRSPMYQPSNVG